MQARSVYFWRISVKLPKPRGAPPRPIGAGRHEAAASPPPAAYGKAVCGAPHKCADCAVRMASGVSESRKEQSKLKAADTAGKRSHIPLKIPRFP